MLIFWRFFKRRSIFIVLKLVFKNGLRFMLSNPHQITIIRLMTQSPTFLLKAVHVYRFSLSFEFAHMSSAQILMQLIYITFTFQCRNYYFFAKELVLNCRLVIPGPTFEEAAKVTRLFSYFQK